MYNAPLRKKLICLLAIIVIAMLCACAVLVGCKNSVDEPLTDNPSEPPSSSDGGDGGVEEKELSQITVGNVRVQLLSETLVRIEEKGPEGFEDRESYLITNRTDWNEVPYTAANAEGSVKISTSGYDVIVTENARSIEDAVVTDKDGNILWRYEGLTSSNVYLPSPSDELSVWYFSDSPRIIPSEYGYTPTDEDLELQGWDFDNDSPDFFIFLPEGDYTAFCQNYTDLTGKSEMVSLQMLGYWDSRWYAYSAETALQQIYDYIDRGYSIDILVIDTDWRQSSDSGIGYEINTDLFPNLAAFLETCHDIGINIAFNDHPEPVSGTTNVLDGEEVEYRNENLTLLLSLGLDYWWYDRNWTVALNSVDPDVSVYAFGMYCYQWITKSYLESITDLDDYCSRALIMGNVDGVLNGKWMYASDISAHRYTIQWTGDIGSDSTALAQEIYTAIFGGAEVGIPWMSSDIGGHTAAVTDEMYVRWIQYGALSAIMRVHCTNASYIGQIGRMPWLFGETAEEVTQEYVGMRYRLLMLFYSLAHENYSTGLPVLRRLDIYYPQYVEASRNDEYLLGENILIAPISEGEVMTAVPESWLSHEENGATVSGLAASYYTGTSWTGTARTTTDSSINFNWGTGGPSILGVSDGFSVEWTGNITIGERAARLRFYADDGVLVYIDGVCVINGLNVYDTLLSTEYYEAGSVHTITVKYFEDGGNAHIYMYYSELTEDGTAEKSVRTVFLPDGEWIDVWTGERFVGPQTITVAHGLTTSPIFVRAGSVFALAENMVNTSEKDWSNVALDVYPGQETTAFTIYEDDTATTAYKDGFYRTTTVTQNYLGGTSYGVTIAAAEGSFEGALAFTERTYTVRIHAPEEWGSLLSITLNGKPVSVYSIARDGDASPFAFEGGSPDARIYTFTFTAGVYSESQIVFSFANAAKEIELPEYDSTELDFTLTSDEVGDILDLTAAGTLDWAYFGADANATTVRKDTETSLIGNVSSYDSNWMFTDSVVDVSWSDGVEIASAADVTSGIVSQKDFSLTLTTAGEAAYYVIYASGYMSTAKLTVRDRAGNVKTITFGNIDGKYCRRVIIGCSSDAVSALYVTYSVVSSVPSGTGSASNVALTCVYVSASLPEVTNHPFVNVEAEVVSSEAPPASVNLTETEDLLDWATFSGAGNRVSRAEGDAIGSVTFSAGQGFYDYSSVISWTDGYETPANAGTRNGTCTPGQIAVSFNVDSSVKGIILYTGTWRSTNTVYVYDREGNLIAQSLPFSAGETAVTRRIYIAISAEAATKITVVIQSTDAYNSGNVSLAAIVVTGGETEMVSLAATVKQYEE